MLSNFNVAFGFVRNYGRILFKKAGIYYDGTNVVVRMLNNGSLVVVSKNNRLKNDRGVYFSFENSKI